MKYLKNYLSGDYDCIGQYDCRVKFYFIEYLIICLMQPKKEMIIFNHKQNKMLEKPRLSTVKFKKNISKQEDSYTLPTFTFWN